MQYTIEQLIKLRDVQSQSLNNDEKEELWATDRYYFVTETSKFLNWLKMMEKENKIEEMLNS